MNPQVDALLARASEHAKAEEWPNALRVLAEATAHDKDDVRIYLQSGRLLLQNGRPDLAHQHLAAVVRARPGVPEGQLDLAVALALDQQMKEAKEVVETYRQRFPMDQTATKLLILLDSQLDEHENAIALIKESLLRSPDDVESLVLQANYLAFRGDIPGAIRVLSRAVAVDPTSVNAGAALRTMNMPHMKGTPAGGKTILMLVEDRRIDRRVLDEARSLAAAGWAVTVLAGQPPQDNPFWDEECYPDIAIVRTGSISSLACDYEVDGKVLDVRVPLTSVNLSQDELNRFVAEAFPDASWSEYIQSRIHFLLDALAYPASVIVAHDLPMLPVAAIAAKYHRARVVYDSHELFPDQYSDKRVWERLQKVERYLISKADLVITVNQSIAQVMRERYGVVPHVILNCPAEDPLKLPVPRSTLLRDELRIPEHQKLLLYQGGLVGRLRNLEALIEGMSLLRRDDIALVMMGPDSGGKKALMERARAREMLGSHVFFRDAVRQNDLLRYTASADAGIIPYPALDLLNQYYCTPNKTFEFIVAGLPIIASDLPELRRFVSDQGVGVNFPMKTAEDIAYAIDRFFDSDLTVFRRSVQALSHAYVWETQGRKLVSIYQALEP